MGLFCQLFGHKYNQDDVCIRCGTSRGSQGLKFKQSPDKKGYILISANKCHDTSVQIPRQYKGKPVTAIGPHAFDGYNGELTLTLPATVTTIGKRAFAHSGLCAIHLGELTDLALGSGAFFECDQLVEAVLPSTLTELPTAVFAGCVSLAELTIPDGVTTIGAGALERCRSLRKLFCPDTVTTIDNSAFAGCESLERIRLPDGLTELPARLLADCAALTSLDIPAGITHIGDGALWGCSSLTSIMLPETVTSIASNAFRDCTSIETFTFPESLTNFVPNKEGEGDVFRGCSTLREITLHTGFKHFPVGMLADCTSLTDIRLVGGKSLDWRSIQKDEGFDEGSGTYVVHLINGRIRKGA